MKSVTRERNELLRVRVRVRARARARVRARARARVRVSQPGARRVKLVGVR